ncbi:MAG TPA: hypothetical protein VGG12_05415 [Methylovirgula sp.]
MRAFAALLICAFTTVPTLALADPTGSYNVSGKNADDSTYSGTVTVSRTGATYKVVWDINGKQSIGTGLGSHFKDASTFVTGPATDDDTGLSVCYINKDSFGIATYYKQNDGTWAGVWTYGDSQAVTTETWRPEK